MSGNPNLLAEALKRLEEIRDTGITVLDPGEMTETHFAFDFAHFCAPSGPALPITGCLAGLICMMTSPKEDRVESSQWRKQARYKAQNGANMAALVGMTETNWRRLTGTDHNLAFIYGTPGNTTSLRAVTVEMMIAVLRHYLETGAVDWSVAKQETAA